MSHNEDFNDDEGAELDISQAQKVPCEEIHKGDLVVFRVPVSGAATQWNKFTMVTAAPRTRHGMHGPNVKLSTNEDLVGIVTDRYRYSRALYKPMSKKGEQPEHEIFWVFHVLLGGDSHIRVDERQFAGRGGSYELKLLKKNNRRQP